MTKITPRGVTDSGKQNGAKVLVVDDSEGVLQSVAFFLKKEGMQPVLARDGAEAISKLEGESFSLVITDLEMPRVHGLELLKWIREREPLLPTVVMSGNLPSDANAVLGAKTLAKPFDTRDLEAVLRSIQLIPSRI